jgi:phosphoribosylanthranilate isomerase
LTGMLVKICGITRLEDAALAADLGASAIGFVFWPPSPRFVDPSRAGRVTRALASRMTFVGVFVNQPAEEVSRIADVAGLDQVQLHGTESPDYCGHMRHPVIKAVCLGHGPDSALVTRFPRAVTLLLDAHDPIRHGGTGQTVNWQRAAVVARERPVILSGGLRAENVASAIRTVRPLGIDVSSGVESQPGVKDPERLRRFIKAVHECEARSSRPYLQTAAPQGPGAETPTPAAISAHLAADSYPRP